MSPMPFVIIAKIEQPRVAHAQNSSMAAYKGGNLVVASCEPAPFVVRARTRACRLTEVAASVDSIAISGVSSASFQL